MPPGALWRCRGRRDGHTARADVVHGVNSRFVLPPVLDLPDVVDRRC